VAVTAFLFLVLGLVTRWSWRTRVALVGVIALATELAQLARLPLRRSLLTDLTIGSTFDPWDLLAYALGLLLAALVHRRFLG
jgi:prepilin signal peptidase PulO-like enzyme (type II secretory pathway)